MIPNHIFTSDRCTIRFFNCDCNNFLKECGDKSYSLGLVDPPYGIGINGSVGGEKCAKVKQYKNKGWDKKIPKPEYFKQLFRISHNQIIWGGNYMLESLHNTSCFLVWDKNNSGNFADCELAWTSFNSAVRLFKFTWNGMIQENMKNKEIRIHETQKPVKLYRWILQNYAKKGDTIIDTHGGSFSLAIACEIEGFDLDIMEKDVEYFDQALNRFKIHVQQKRLF